MTVEVRFAAGLQPLVDGQKTLLGEGETIGELLKETERKYPAFREQILTEEGRIQGFVNVYLNGEDIRFLTKEETPLFDGDVLFILLAR